MQIGDLVRYIGKRKHIKTVGIITATAKNKSSADVLWGCGRHSSHGSRHLKLLKESA